MRRLTVQAFLSVVLTETLAFGLASGPAIGLATATGSFRLDNSQVFGNATLFEGASVQTDEASSRLQLNNGARIELAPESRARVFVDRVMLDQGLGELTSSSGYRVEARTLRISAASAATARILIDGPNTVMVAAENGPVHVYNKIGLLVANLSAGTSLSFEPQAGQEESFKMAGCLLKKEKKFILVDQTSNQVVELRGDNLEANWGNRIEIAGTAFRAATPVAGATQVIQVTTVKAVGTGGCLAVAGTIPGAELPSQKARGPAGAEASKHTGAIIAGVVVGAGAAVGAAVALSGGKKSSSP